MPKKNVDTERVRIASAPTPESSIKRLEEVYILVTQAFCSKGHNLINDGNELFDGHLGIRVLVESGGKSGYVTLSPFHGDDTKKGSIDWPNGTKLAVKCPHCASDLPRLGSCRCPGSGDLVMLYMSPNLSTSNIIAMCNIWGCRRSRTIDNWQIISEYFDGHVDE